MDADLIERLLADPSQVQDVPAGDILRIHTEVACDQMKLAAFAVGAALPPAG